MVTLTWLELAFLLGVSGMSGGMMLVFCCFVLSHVEWLIKKDR